MSTYQYIKSDAIINIIDLFDGYMYKGGVKSFESTGGLKMRDRFFEFFNAKPFQKYYHQLALDVAESLGVKNEKLLLQPVPTPRIFRPGDHGTSFHCDYWYGHGERSYTIWTPLTLLDEGNTFRLCSDTDNVKYYDLLALNNGKVSNEYELLRDSHPAMPPESHSVVFGSKVIHGSPKNISNKERLSFDFRIGALDDETTTKDPAGYLKFDGNTFIHQLNKFNGKRFLKYICGGNNRNTIAQHLLIESASKHYSFSIDGQEAEVERFGNAIFNEYLDSLAVKKGFDGIVISSISLLDQNTLKKLEKNNNIVVYAVMENRFFGT
jgi:hypothetical protein